MFLPLMSSAQGLRVSDFVWCEQPLLVLSYPLPRPLALHRLTACEAAVVLLAQAGISNKEIARVRAASVRTVANQLASAYRKLGGASRACLKARAELVPNGESQLQP